VTTKVKERNVTTSNVDFSAWFIYGCIGGLVSCMFAITVNVLYTTLRKRGTTRQLAVAIISCVVSESLLLPAIIWFNSRFSSAQVTISVVEVTLALVFVALCGWVFPLSVTTAYCLFTQPRDSNTSVRIRRQQSHRKRTTRGNAIAGAVPLPKRQPGVLAPFVFGQDIPWGWLEHRSGRFQGQKLALTRTVMSIGREEDNDIWLDDETSSRYHAELAWDGEQVYITDCNSLNGVLLNGRRIRGTLVVKSGDLLEIGSHRFLYENAEPPIPLAEQDDPLLHHLRRSSTSPVAGNPGESQFGKRLASANALPTKPLDGETPFELSSLKLDHVVHQLPQSTPGEINSETGDSGTSLEAVGFDPITPPPQVERPAGLCLICNGEMAGRSFLLDRSELTVGRSAKNDVIIHDDSISDHHAVFLHQEDGDYVRDLGSYSGTRVNDEPLKETRLLQKEDIISLGIVRLEYTVVPEAQTTSLPLLPIAAHSYPLRGPTPLRLPSKPK
jgi:pSer/pThr/pTyr-binding forkhead associated (FHA) protein